MKNNLRFFNLYEQFSGRRLIAILVLLALGSGVLIYFNQLAQTLDEREQRYAKLYAESIRFLNYRSNVATDDCDYTFVEEVISANETIPVITLLNGEPSNFKNIPELEGNPGQRTPEEVSAILKKKIPGMAAEHPPITMKVDGMELAIYYSSSLVVKQLRYFPYVLIVTFLIFGALAFIAYSSSRKAEENRVWVGLAKETAHQLGTPISGLMGWIEVLRTTPDFDESIAQEMTKDVDRLKTITTRFSNIGSIPQMKQESISEILETTIGYLERRISRKVKWHYSNQLAVVPHIMHLNRPLIEWVIENLCKNAVDAMAGVGELHISIQNLPKNRIAIDIRDTGKGISSRHLSRIFQPGFSTKKRGWGLGLTLAKRIIETYHNGRLFVKETQVNKGTTFRIIL